MAEDKKPEKGGKGEDKKGGKKPEGWDLDVAESLIILFIVVTIVSASVPAIWSFVTGGELSFYGIKLSSIYDFFIRNIQFFKILGYFIATVAAVMTIVFNKKADAIWREEKKRLYPAEMPMGETASTPLRDPTTDKWAEIVAKSESKEENSWRLAIIEADIILDSLLEKLNLPGQTIGDKLKAVEPSDFLTLDQAWEAHKARNQIAHNGSDFILNQREVRRIISLYEAVFREFHLI